MDFVHQFDMSYSSNLAPSDITFNNNCLGLDQGSLLPSSILETSYASLHSKPTVQQNNSEVHNVSMTSYHPSFNPGYAGSY